MESKFETQFWSKSGFDVEKERYSKTNKKDESRIKKSKTKEKTIIKVSFI